MLCKNKTEWGGGVFRNVEWMGRIYCLKLNSKKGLTDKVLETWKEVSRSYMANWWNRVLEGPNSSYITLTLRICTVPCLFPPHKFLLCCERPASNFFILLSPRVTETLLPWGSRIMYVSAVSLLLPEGYFPAGGEGPLYAYSLNFKHLDDKIFPPKCVLQSIQCLKGS